jgi:hypothetical protein
MIIYINLPGQEMVKWTDDFSIELYRLNMFRRVLDAEMKGPARLE